MTTDPNFKTFMERVLDQTSLTRAAADFAAYSGFKNQLIGRSLVNAIAVKEGLFPKLLCDTEDTEVVSSWKEQELAIVVKLHELGHLRRQQKGE